MFRTVIAFVCAAAFALRASAGEPAPEGADPRAAELNAAFEAASGVMVRGPSDVKVIQQAVLHLPEKYGYIPKKEADRLLKAMGNTPGENERGMVVPLEAQGLPWFAVLSFAPEGYIKDDDAKDLDADEILKSITEGTEADNERRRLAGFTEMEVVGWAEAPRYDAATHRLVWSLTLRDKGQPAGAEQGVNYQTRMLGREGYVALNMVTDLSLLDGYRGDANTLLAALEFNAGKRYADFNSGTDRVAEYGLVALVAGVAAKKLGLLALIGVGIAKFWKLTAIAIAGAAAGFKKLFKKQDGGGPTVA